MKLRGLPIEQNVLEKAWVPSKRAWNLEKPSFVFFKLFLFLNFVSSCSLANHFVNSDDDSKQYSGIKGPLVVIDLVSWTMILISNN